jgi:hypothetical protein
MKLIGSKTEQDYREELLASREYHFSNHTKSRLKGILEEAGHTTKNAFVLHWTPDQAEDFFFVLVDGAYLVSTCIDRYDDDSKPDVSRYELEAYVKGLSRMNQVRLLVAQALANA